MRTLPEPVSEASRWLLVCGLAFFLADAASATLERQLSVAPLPLTEVTLAVPQSSVAVATSPELIRLLSATQPPTAVPSGPSVTPVASATAAPAERQISVTLVGSMAGLEGSGLAMLSVGGESVVASLGEPVADWTLSAVYPTSVVLERAGKSETLEFNEPTNLATTAATPNGGSATPVPSPPAGIPTAAATPEPAPPAPSGPVEPLTSQEELLSLLDNNMPEIMKQGRLKSVVRNGEVLGLEIGVKDPAFPLARLGLRTGDIVMSLNGVEVKGPADTHKLLGTLRNSNTLSFEIEREGQKTTHKVELVD